MPPAARVLHEEIFGPVLPLLTWKHEREALDFINARENPLAMYVFSRDAAAISRFHRGTRAGGGAVNDALFHYFNQNLPLRRLRLERSGPRARRGRLPRLLKLPRHHAPPLQPGRPSALSAVHPLVSPPDRDTRAVAVGEVES